jgi:hypothetical protein
MNSRPSGILSKDKMADLLVDINLAESAMRVGKDQHSSLADSMYQKSMYLKVYEKNDVTPDEFRKSLDFYTKNIEDLNDIFTEVIDRLNSMQAEIEGKKTEKDEGSAPKTHSGTSSTSVKPVKGN